MPELPEVEQAAHMARDAATGRTIDVVRVLHPSLRRALPDEVAASLSGDQVRTVTRRGKHQLLILASGRTLHVHFRMTGSWSIGSTAEPLARHARVVMEFTDASRLSLDDARALALVTLYESGVDPLPDLGPEANADDFTTAWLSGKLSARRGPIKPVLLDQSLVAGIGNIYASESLWYAKVDPRRMANRLTRPRLAAVVAGVKRAMRKAFDRQSRYYGSEGEEGRNRFNVYDREGAPCRRCGASIRRLVQAGRSTYYCRGCQR